MPVFIWLDCDRFTDKSESNREFDRKIDMIGPEDLNTEVLVEINEEETPLAQAPEEQKEEFGMPFSDPGYKLFYYLYGIIISLVILMTLFLWRFREDKGY